MMSCEPVPRMPMLFQTGMIFTLGEFIGMPKCSTCAPLPSPSHTAVVISRLPTGAPDENTLRAVILKPPSTFSALPEPAIQSEPPLDRMTIFSAAMRFSSGSTGAAF